MAGIEPRRLVLRNDLAELQRLAGWVEGWAQQDVSPDVSFAIQFCLEEAVANVIMHGAPKGDPLEIAVELAREDRTLIARIEDNGTQFDPTKAPPPQEPASLVEAQPGNLGVHLVRNIADDMDYERRDGRNRLTLRFVEPRTAP